MISLTFSSSAGFFIKTADLYLKHCFDSSYKYALLSGPKIRFRKTSELADTGTKTPKSVGDKKKQHRQT